ncbi:MAG: FtsK/SpoIIIE domain-containing protein [Acidimicrobiales bacterium]
MSPLRLAVGNEIVTVQPDPRADVGDLAVALGFGRCSLRIDGRWRPPDADLRTTGIGLGSHVADGGAAVGDDDPGDEQPPVLVTIAGPASGRRLALRGPSVVGGAPWAGLTLEGLAPTHLVADPDGEGVSLTWLSGEADRPDRLAIGDRVTIGCHRLEVRSATHPGAVPLDEGCWTATARRGHRSPANPEPVAVPESVPDAPGPPAATALTTTAIVAAGSFGVASITGHALLALGGLLGAVAAATGYGIERLRHRRARRRVDDRRRSATATFLDAVAEHLDAVVACEHRRHPDLDRLLEAATSETGPWPRRRDDPDWGIVAFARRRELLTPTVTGQGPAVPIAIARRDDVPATITLGRGIVVGVVGPRTEALPVARALALTLVALHRPSTLRLVVTTTPDRADDWAWTEWLAPGDGLDVVVVDGPPGPLPADAAVVVVAGDPAVVPGGCDTVIDATGAGVIGCDVAVATRLARALARWSDPDRAGAGMPETVVLEDLLSSPGATGTTLDTDPDTLPIVLGSTSNGPLVVDLVADGPHVLVAGTTGSGKSEALRTLVLAGAHARPPEDLSFLLVDFKGGATFDACRSLPHVTGVVTDLDGDLAERVLRCLRAELRRREQVLRDAGVSDRRGLRSPFARLVVVVDELAALVGELGGSNAALIELAQRGRSLGIHLVLATQRPAGVVDPAVRANVNTTIALRVADEAEARAVVGDATPARFRRAGQAVLRRGGGPLETVQVAAVRHPEVLVADLAARSERAAPPARPWVAPLPDRLERSQLPRGAVGLIDDPDRLDQRPALWSPADGALVVVGPRGSGVRTALGAALAAAAESGAWHRYRIGRSADPQDPAVTVVHPSDRERVERLLVGLARRAEASSGRPAAPTVVVIDDVAALRAGFEDPAGARVLAALETLLRAGPEIGTAVVLGADRAGAIPPAWHVLVTDTWTLGGTEASSRRACRPGRAISARDGLERHLAIGPPGIPGVPTPPIPVLGPSVALGDLGTPTCRTGRWTIPIGLGDDLQPVAVELRPGEPFLVTGPRRSGRTNALGVLVAGLRTAGADVRILGSASDLPPVPTSGRPVVVVIDDAERRADLPSGVEGATILAAARPELLRSGYGHWIADLRRHRHGLVLGPLDRLETDALGVPPWRTAPLRGDAPGRGALVAAGDATLVQVAHATTPPCG